MTDLTTAAAAKLWANITGTSDDALITALVTAASRFIETWCGRSFSGVAAFTETQNGRGNQQLCLANYPVTAVSSVSVDGAAIPLRTTVTGSGYSWDLDGNVYLSGYSFTRAAQNVTIVYNAGYAAVPAEIAQACNELVGLIYKKRDRIGQSSKSIGGQETVSFIVKDMPDDVKVVLQNYKKVVPV